MNAFFSFLIATRNLDKFKANYENYKWATPFDEFLSRNNLDHGVIGSSFDWSKTPEGLEYWNDISKQCEMFFIGYACGQQNMKSQMNRK